MDFGTHFCFGKVDGARWGRRFWIVFWIVIWRDIKSHFLGMGKMRDIVIPLCCLEDGDGFAADILHVIRDVRLSDRARLKHEKALHLGKDN